MNIRDIKSGGKYFKKVTDTQRRSTKVKTTVIKVYVLEVNLPGMQVLASYNGAPAEWMNGNQISFWTKEDPSLKLI